MTKLSATKTLQPEDLLQSPFASHRLHRYPKQKQDNLRAWDAADEYLLDYCNELKSDLLANAVILNDGFGALAVSLHTCKPCNISDSFLTHAAIRQNLTLNHCDTNGLNLCDFTHLQCKNTPQLAIIKLPKNLLFLRYQLALLRKLTPTGLRIISAGMSKHIPRTVYDLLSQELDDVTVSLTRKKAKIISGTLPMTGETDKRANHDTNHAAVDLFTTNQQLLDEFTRQYELEPYSLRFTNYPNLFGQNKLDAGTRFLIEHFPSTLEYKRVIDLACGNGILGSVAARINPSASIHFCDESFLAIASARKSALQNFDATDVTRRFQFAVDDCLSHYQGPPADLILCNPPFHQQHSVTTHISWRMFAQARQHLASGGQLLVIANRHLGYQASLKRLFQNVVLFAQNPKFVILGASNG